MKSVVIYTEGPSDFHLLAGLLMRFHQTHKLPKPISIDTKWILQRKIIGVIDLQVELRCGNADSNEASSDVTAFIHPGQCSVLRKMVSIAIENGTKVLFILDADIDVLLRREQVRTAHQTEYFNVDDCVFFWPDNASSNQEFEHLLPDIAAIPEIFGCWDTLEDCIKKIDNEYLGTESQRAKVLRKHGYYLYNDFLRRENTEAWDFDHPRLQNLIAFLDRHINEN